MKRAFILQFVYLALLGLIVVLAWPGDVRIDTRDPEAAQQLVNLFFLGQFFLASLMAPTFAAGTITGEKERKTYEMLLAGATDDAERNALAGALGTLRKWSF